MTRPKPFRRFTESTCRQLLMGALSAAGIYHTPIEDKLRKGIPDLYVDGGVWVECKHLVMVARGRGMNVIQQFHSSQKMRLNRPNGRDLNLAAFLMTTPAGEARFFICRFSRLYSTTGGPPEDRCLWTFKKAKEWGVTLEDAPRYIRAVLWDRWQGAMKHIDLDPDWPGDQLLPYYKEPWELTRVEDDVAP